jgi:peroxiredoxin
MQRLAELMSTRPFQILAVNSEETRSRVWKFSKLLNISFPTLLDTNGDVTRRWEVEIFPTSYLIDTRGQIRYISYGALEWDQDEVIDTIETLMPDHPSADSAAFLQAP